MHTKMIEGPCNGDCIIKVPHFFYLLFFFTQAHSIEKGWDFVRVKEIPYLQILSKQNDGQGLPDWKLLI